MRRFLPDATVIVRARYSRSREMLERAGVTDAGRRVDPKSLEAVLPRVSEAAYRARFNHDDAAILQGALG